MRKESSVDPGVPVGNVDERFGSQNPLFIEGRNAGDDLLFGPALLCQGYRRHDVGVPCHHDQLVVKSTVRIVDDCDRDADVCVLLLKARIVSRPLVVTPCYSALPSFGFHLAQDNTNLWLRLKGIQVGLLVGSIGARDQGLVEPDEQDVVLWELSLEMLLQVHPFASERLGEAVVEIEPVNVDSRRHVRGCYPKSKMAPHAEPSRSRGRGKS